MFPVELTGSIWILSSPNASSESSADWQLRHHSYTRFGRYRQENTRGGQSETLTGPLEPSESSCGIYVMIPSSWSFLRLLLRMLRLKFTAGTGKNGKRLP